MLKRRGFSLMELLIVIAMIGIIGIALSRVFTSVMITSSAQVRVAATQGEARVGALLLPQELREIGYDTNTTTNSASSDLVLMEPAGLGFFAARGMGITCGTPTLSEFRIRRGIVGQRVPLLTDRILLFLEFDPNAAFDDQWVPMTVSAIDLNSTCDGSDPAIRFTLSATPLIAPGVNMALTNHRIGGPIRWFERMEYARMLDATTGEYFLGRRSVSLGETSLQPIIGPLSGPSGIAITYFDATGTAVSPGTADPLVVRSIQFNLSTTTGSDVSLAGSTNRAQSNYPIVMRVSLRNSLRP